MTVKELLDFLQRRVEVSPRCADNQVVIPVSVPVNIGGTACVKVKSLDVGFDWDNGKFFIIPEESVEKTDLDRLEQIRKLQEELGWALYENRNLKSDIKKLRK